jgi:hypothetical protein
VTDKKNFPRSVITAAPEFESHVSVSFVDLVNRADFAGGNGGALAAGVSIDRERTRSPDAPFGPAASESWII